MHYLRAIVFGAAGVLAIAASTGAATGVAWAASGSGKGSGASGAPPGNNGTVKIDQYTMDPGQDNDPHVGCPFSVSFFGYDSGLQIAQLTLTPVAPTAGSSSYQTSTQWNVTRTSGNTFDANVQITGDDLSGILAGITPQPQQGYHLRLEVEVTGSQGSDDKYKVFWMAPCEQGGNGGTTTTTSSTSTSTTTSTTLGSAPTTSPTTAPTTTSPTTGGNKGGGGTTVPTTSTSHSTGSVSNGSSSAGTASAATGSNASPSAAVPVASPAAASAVTADQGSLAFTGRNVEGLALFGVLLIGSGGAIVVRARRRPGRKLD